MNRVQTVGSGKALAFAAFLLAGAQAGLGQGSISNNLIPVVTIRATDPIALESGKPATFEVDRAGSTNASLLVYYDIAGTASNGLDYATLTHWVTVPAGVTAAKITVQPLGDSSTETNEEGTRTIILQLGPSPLMIPINYTIGCPSNAVAYLFDDDATSNLPPVANLIAPPDGAVYYTPTNLQLIATSFDVDGVITNVEFFAGTNDLGRGLPVVLDPPGVNGVVGLVYFLSWADVPPGKYALTAVATDNQGASTTSDPHDVIVLPGPPPTNLPPVVRIVSPSDRSVFRAPIDLPIHAYARDPDGSVSSVEFFAGTNSLGFGHVIPVPVPPPLDQFVLVWSNAPAGRYALTAVATDNGGATSTSPPVHVTLLGPLPPPTNRPPVVSVVAIDPVAVEGTNAWIWRGLTNTTPSWDAWPGAACGFFTNCGPKNALFKVRRCGDTNSSLTVAYELGGTASNGVDYVGLPGFATISAGERAALITVVPIDDGPPDVNKTVILGLTPSTNTPPDYLLGFPRRAAAVIIDRNRPRPPTGMLPGSCFHLHATGPDGAWFRVECSTNLRNWTFVCTNQVIEGSIDFVDPDAGGSSTRFYRAVPETGPALP